MNERKKGKREDDFSAKFTGILVSRPMAPTNKYSFKAVLNKILDRDWFSARLFVMKSALDHVGVQLQVSTLNFCDCIPIIKHPRDFYVDYGHFKVFRYSFSDAIPIFFNRLRSVFFLVRSRQNFHQ